MIPHGQLKYAEPENYSESRKLSWDIKNGPDPY